MADDLLGLAVDEGPGAFVPRKDLASPDALVRLGAVQAAESVERFYREVAEVRPDPSRKAKRKAARAARRRNR